jgi:hypothetical protein
MISDWKNEIAIAWLVQSEIEKLDKRKIWRYYLPKVCADESELIRTEKILGRSIDPAYRTFLKYAKGWPCFCGYVDLFGTEELTGFAQMHWARSVIRELSPLVIEQRGLTREALFAIAADPRDVDVYALWPSHGNDPGEVIWFAHQKVERFATFNCFFLAMVDYNRLRLQRLQKGEI